MIVTATNYLQFIDFSALRDELLTAAAEGDLVYIAKVLTTYTGDDWGVSGLDYSLYGAEIIRYGENRPEYFTHDCYAEVVSIKLNPMHNTLHGIINLQMTRR